MAVVHFLNSTERGLLEAVSRLAYANPFLPERVELERAALGAEFVEGEPVWSYRAEAPGPRENVWRLHRKLEPLLEFLRACVQGGGAPAESELALYEDAVLQFLY